MEFTLLNGTRNKRLIHETRRNNDEDHDNWGSLFREPQNVSNLFPAIPTTTWNDGLNTLETERDGHRNEYTHNLQNADGPRASVETLPEQADC